MLQEIRRRTGGTLAVGALLVALSLSVALLTQSRGRADPESPVALQVFHTPPVLVRAGDQVQIPVDVICVTAEGTSCPANVVLSVVDQGGAVTDVATPAAPDLVFDLSAPVQRAISGPATSGAVGYAIRGESASGSVAYLGTTTPALLHVYVTETLPTIEVPSVPFGQTSRGHEVLYLPWGTGPYRAGLRPGNESPTYGPSSFDIGPSGHVVLFDPIQSRIAEFADGVLMRSVKVGDRAGDVAVGQDGTVFLATDVADTDFGGQVQTIDASNIVQTISYLPGDPVEIRRSENEIYVHLSPLDAWTSVSDHSESVAGPSMGRPVDKEEQLLVSGDVRSIRVAMLRADQVVNAVEIESKALLGGVALADTDGVGGYVVVLHTVTETPKPADQFQVVHVTSDLRVETFATPSALFADSMPASRFRMGPDGALYQMQTRADGVHIVSFQVGGHS